MTTAYLIPPSKGLAILEAIIKVHLTELEEFINKYYEIRSELEKAIQKCPDKVMISKALHNVFEEFLCNKVYPELLDAIHVYARAKALAKYNLLECKLSRNKISVDFGFLSEYQTR